MTFTNRNSNTPASGGGGFLKVSEGAVLTPAAGVITPTDPVHHVAAGTVSSIATTNLDTNVDQPLFLVADGAVTITLGATIVGRTTALAANDVILYVLDGGTAWREVAVIRALINADIPAILSGKTLVTPTIASFVNAAHNHTNAAGGGQLTKAALSDFTEWAAYSPTPTASAGTITGGAIAARSRKFGKSCRVVIEATGWTLSGTPTHIDVPLPAGVTCAAITRAPVDIRDGGTFKHGSVFVGANATVISFYVAAEATGTWAGGANNDFTCAIEIETTT